jgi:hypothetical protein
MHLWFDFCVILQRKFNNLHAAPSCMSTFVRELLEMACGTSFPSSSLPSRGSCLSSSVPSLAENYAGRKGVRAPSEGGDGDPANATGMQGK